VAMAATLERFARDDWPRAVRACGLTHRRVSRRDRWTGKTEPVESMPKISGLRNLPGGVIVGKVRAADGTEIAQVIPYTRRIAASLGMHDVYIEPADHAHGTIYLIPRDPWPGRRPWLPPTTTKADKVEFATDPIGRRLSVPLMNVSFLIGASKGGGKSVLEFVLAAGAACRENVILLGCDPKGTELQFFEQRFSYIAEDPAGFGHLLHALEREMARRYAALKRLRLKQFEHPSAEFPAIWLVVDEGREVVDTSMPGPWKKGAANALGTLAYLAQKGRAAGISIIFATQHPDAKVIPTTFRSQMLNRWCGITEGPNQAMTIIGQESAQQVDTKTLRPGTGYFQREGKAALPLVLVDWLDENGADKVDAVTAKLRPEHTAFDALRDGGTFNPAPANTAPEAEEPVQTGWDSIIESLAAPADEVLEAAEFVARWAGVDASQITDGGTAMTAVVAAAEKVEGHPELVEQLVVMSRRLKDRYQP
jgi:hypothetical protein